MRVLFIIFSLLSFNLIASSEDGYKSSQCYADYKKVYQKGVSSNEKVRKTNMRAAMYGMTLPNNKASTWGHSEKIVMNAAKISNVELLSNNTLGGGTYLNEFKDLYESVEKEYPEIDPKMVIGIIQNGFTSGDFCKKFLFIPSRKSISGVKRYVKQKLHALNDRSLAVEINTADRDDVKLEKKKSFIKEASSSSKVIE